MTGIFRRSACQFALCLGGLLLTVTPTTGATHLYTGSIHVRLSYSTLPGYYVPFGNMLSYPDMQNSPTGDYATVTGSAPAAVALGANHITLHTSLDSPSPPFSWGVTEAASTFSGGHSVGSFFASGAPGSASSAPLSGVSTGGFGSTGLPGSVFGIRFKGTPTNFGGTMALLGNHRVRWNAASPLSQVCSDCTILTRPLSPIGGAFGGMASAGTYVNGSYQPFTYFDVTVWGFPWTTGSVTARAPAPTGVVNSLAAKGFDERTPGGAGNLQLVTPFLIRYTVDRPNEANTLRYQPGIAIANLQFVPEPSTLAMLAAGVVLLVALATTSRRFE